MRRGALSRIIAVSWGSEVISSVRVDGVPELTLGDHKCFANAYGTAQGSDYPLVGHYR